MIKKIEKSICLPKGVDLRIDLNIAIGENYVPEALNSGFVDNVLINQITKGVNNATEKYAQSPLPNSFLNGQKIIVTNDMPPYSYGEFDKRTDDIFLDSDGISIGLREVNPEFLFGHEMGHKFQKYRSTEDIYRKLASFFGISYYDQRLLGEVYSDIVGNIARFGYLGDEHSNVLARAGIKQNEEPIFHLDTYISPEESAYIKKRVLHNIYRG